ncbi:MAG: CAF17-like 4Fe-4S cluster assembly/insertion protein YgfZ [Actinomycetota bacterium]
MMANTIDEQLQAWDEGRAFADLSGWWKLRVSGGDAVSWLQDLLSADVAALPAGAAGPSLLLTPTGRVRAALWVARLDDAVVLLQPADQPEPAGRILDPYALSSDVTLTDATDLEGLSCVPDRAAGLLDGVRVAPSWLGSGVDVVAPAADARAALARAGLTALDEDAVETLRILSGRPRMGVDFGPEHLAAEAGMDVAIAYDKGCYLGQESVAKVRNLGHPPSVLRRVGARTFLRAQDRVLADGAEAGTVTSAAVRDGRCIAFVRVRWGARDRPLASSDGTALSAVPLVA